AGAHWTTVMTLSGATEVMVAATPLDPTLVYAAASGSGKVQFLASHDAGATWQNVPQSGLPTDSAAFGYLAVSPSDARTLYRGLLDLYRSTDGGAHWTNLTRNYDGDS